MKGSRFFGLGSLLISAIFLVLSFFVEWISGYTLYQMYSLFHFTPTFILYLFPIFAIILLIIGYLSFISKQKQIEKISLLILFFDLNLIFIFIIQMIQIHGEFLWQHPGIFLGILSTAFFLLGFIFLLNSILGKSNESE